MEFKMNTKSVIIVIAVIGFGLFFLTDAGKKVFNEAFNEEYNECRIFLVESFCKVHYIY